MLEAGDRIVAGISGGADSVCLLFLLLEWAKRTPLEIGVVHVNHGIRQSAQEDAAYVEGLCQEHGLKFHLIEADVPAIAQAEKLSLEEAGRKARYEAFERIAAVAEAKIAVAHNSNDRSETMLFHLFRGSGVKGLASIRPVRDSVIRPILCLERREIEAYLEARGIAWCEDVTNASDDYTRNRIRNHILPYAEQYIVQGCVSHMSQAAELLAEAEDYLEQQTREAMERCICREKEAGNRPFSAERGTSGKTCTLFTAELLALHPLLQKRVLHGVVKDLSPQHRDISHRHITDLLDLFTGEGNRSVSLPFCIRAWREYDRVIVGIVDRGQKADRRENIEFTVFPAEEFREKLPQNEYTKCFDYGKIKKSLAFRSRQQGDYLTLSDGSGGLMHKSLKDYMIDRKIPKAWRDQIPVLAEGSHVLWLVGWRISEYYKVTGDTKQILQVQITEEKND